MQEEEIERTLCQLPQVHVFRIPAQKAAEGHRASNWPKDPNWSGKLKIVAKGRTAAIILSDDRNQVFAVCQVTDDSAVQKVLDSGRYFVLRITNQQGRHAFIGIAFNERNDAFDFNVALSEFRGELDREEKAAKFFSEHSSPVDLQLKDGEKIKITLSSKRESSDSKVGKSTSKGGPISLLPPPDMRGTPQTVSGIQVSQSSTSSSARSTATQEDDPFGWGASQPFSSSDPFASTSANDPFGSSTTATAGKPPSSNLLDF